LFIVVFLVLGTAPTFDYHRLLLPSAEKAEISCALHSLRTEHDIEEFSLPLGATAGYVLHDNLKLFLYVTVVERTMQCHYVVDPIISAAKASSFQLHYTQHYLNISRIDVDHQIKQMRERYREPVRLWRYNSHDYAYLLRNQELDRHGLAEHPIDIYKDYSSALIVIKLCLFVATSVVVLFCLALWALWTRYRVSGGRTSRPVSDGSVV